MRSCKVADTILLLAAFVRFCMTAVSYSPPNLPVVKSNLLSIGDIGSNKDGKSNTFISGALSGSVVPCYANENSIRLYALCQVFLYYQLTHIRVNRTDGLQHLYVSEEL